jgi:hypothetical protein
MKTSSKKVETKNADAFKKLESSKIQIGISSKIL